MGVNQMKWEQDLIKNIRTGTDYDDDDHNGRGMITRDQPFKEPDPYEGQVTVANRNDLTFHFLKVRDNAKAILEIGVARNGDDSAVHRFLRDKNDDTIYVGIDLDDKSYLDNPAKNIYTIRGSSSDIDANIEKMKSWGVDQFDFIFIDGLHSINQVVTDWEYTKLLSPTGIVGLHDVSEHPGPYHFVRNLNTDIWNVEILCPTDWGIAFVWRK
jgi:hypothetical protein